MTYAPGGLVLRVQRVLDQERVNLEAALPEVARLVAAPLPGSPASKDQNWMRAAKHSDSVQGTFIYASDTVRDLIHASDQYRTAIVGLLNQPAQLILPIMSCVRAINEAIIRVCWLMDSAITPEERFVRAAADFLAKVQGGISVFQSVEPRISDGREKLHKSIMGRDGAIQHFRDMGLKVKVNESSGQAQNVQLGANVSNVDLKSTDLNLRFMPNLRYAWLLNSAAAHSNNWLMEGLSEPWDQSLSNAIFPVLDLSDALISVLFEYVALPVIDMRRSTHFRRIALMELGPAKGPFIDVHTYHKEMKVRWV